MDGQALMAEMESGLKDLAGAGCSWSLNGQPIGNICFPNVPGRVNIWRGCVPTGAGLVPPKLEQTPHETRLFEIVATGGQQG
jgi:hypothetical protein